MGLGGIQDGLNRCWSRFPVAVPRDRACTPGAPQLMVTTRAQGGGLSGV